MGTIYSDNTVAELERRCHRKGTFLLSPTGMSVLAIKITYLMEELAACNTPAERVELLRREFEVDTTPYPEEPEFEDGENMEMVIETRKFDSYGEFMGSEKSFMLRAGADLNFETIVSHYYDPVLHRRLDTKSSPDDVMFRRAELCFRDGIAEYEITLRQTTEEDLDDDGDIEG